MTAATRTRRTVKPVTCDCAIHGRLIYPCELIPAGVPVRCTINGADYLLSAHGADETRGYRFAKLGGDGAVYDVDTSDGYALCDCPDAVYQQRACKHAISLSRFREQGAV